MKANASAKVQRQVADTCQENSTWICLENGPVQESNERWGRGDRQKTVARSCEHCRLKCFESEVV